MKRGIITIIIFTVVALMMSSCSYNKMVEKQEEVEAQWAQVENVYQRRADLIPNIVNTVKGYAQHEESTLTAVIEARAKATSITIDPTNINPDDLEKFQAAQDQLSSAVSRLLVSVEQYPDLKANEQFMALITELEGSENRIAVERRKFNEVAKDYNQYIRKFPHNIVASIFGFEKVGYFKAKEGADVAPTVQF